jgi:hypothetical protein
MLNVSERTGNNVKTTNAMESNGIVPTIVMNPRVTRRLQGESGIMREDDDLGMVGYRNHYHICDVFHVNDGYGSE